MDTGGLFGVDADCYEYFVHRFTQMDTDLELVARIINDYWLLINDY